MAPVLEAEKMDIGEIISLIPGYDPIATAGDCTFDADAALRACEFFPQFLTHVKGVKAKQPFTLELWQQAIIANAFGWKRPDGTRRYRYIFIYVSRKNGKSLLGGGIINYATFCDGEMGAENYCVAADRDQAMLIFGPAKTMVLENDSLSSRAKIYETSKTVMCPATGSFYRAISAEASTKHGYNGHFIIIDELHAQPNSELVDVLETSRGARKQPMVIYLTTADYDHPSICNEKYKYAQQVRDGIIDDVTFLPVIYEAEQDDDWTDEAVWHKANPNLGVSVSMQYLREEFKKAQRIARYENTFRRLHLNQQTTTDERWIDMDAFNDCQSDVRLEDFAGQECFAGLDLSSTTDLTALVLCFERDKKYCLFSFCWVPGDNVHEREMRDGVPYETWAREGFIEMTPGNVIDYRWVRKKINEIAAKYKIREIAYDPWNAQSLANDLAEEDGFNLVEFRQGWKSMSAPAKEFERAVLGREIAYDGNPVLKWCTANAAVKSDESDNIRPSKAKSTERIDALVAAIMALGRCTVAAAERGSVYETRGMLEI